MVVALPGLVSRAGQLIAVGPETLVDAGEASKLRGRVGAVAASDSVTLLVDALGGARREGRPLGVASV